MLTFLQKKHQEVKSSLNHQIMKTRILLLTFLFSLAGAAGHAQLFKKLKEEVKEATEDAIVQTTADKVAEKTAKSLDKLFEVEFGKNAPQPVGDQQSSLEDLPASYEFDWIYKVKMESDQLKKQDGEIFMTYYFKEGADYWGSEYALSEDQQMFMVYDGPSDQMIMFMDQQGQKMAMAMKFPEIPTDDSAQEEYTMTEIEGKEILGYSCKGYKFENSEHEFISYVTWDAPISFSGIYDKSQHMPNGFNEEWLQQNGETGMVMEMHMTDKKKAKNNITMQCVELAESPRSLTTSEYPAMGSMTSKK